MKKIKEKQEKDWIEFLLECNFIIPQKDIKDFIRGIAEYSFNAGIRHERKSWMSAPEKNKKTKKL